MSTVCCRDHNQSRSLLPSSNSVGSSLRRHLVVQWRGARAAGGRWPWCWRWWARRRRRPGRRRRCRATSCSGTRWWTTATTTASSRSRAPTTRPTASTSPAGPPDASPTDSPPSTPSVSTQNYTYHVRTNTFRNYVQLSLALSFALGAAKLLGFDDFIPPFAGATSDQLLTGVNFASAAAGIREETGQQLGGRISFSGQVQNYQSAVEQLVSILGDEDAAANRLSQCIFTVGMGSNDYLNNYFMPAFYDTGSRYTPAQYADDLAARYTQLLRALYSYGARKVALIGVGQVGCSPNELATQSANGVACVDRINVAVRMFNQRLVGMVDQFNRLLPGAHFTYINIDGIFSDILRAPGGHGLKVTNRGCCGVGRNNGQVTCLPFQTPCPNRNEYLFWDAFHPTEAANVLVGQRAYAARLASDVHPVDLRTLARL
ncbi:hypothetical protein VPH35_010348 [Triticum aestivum]